jgi:hypothetical protein
MRLPNGKGSWLFAENCRKNRGFTGRNGRALPADFSAFTPTRIDLRVEGEVERTCPGTGMNNGGKQRFYGAFELEVGGFCSYQMRPYGKSIN